jgi:hypothetical protein
MHQLTNQKEDSYQKKDPKDADLARETVDEDVSNLADGSSLLRVGLGGA